MCNERFTLRVNCGNGQVENMWSGNEMSEARHFEAIAIKHWGKDDVWICDNLQEIEKRSLEYEKSNW